MSGKRVAIIELFIGLVLWIIGAAVYWWSRQLFWILIYPPPIEKQILDVLPYVIWIFGIVMIIDSIRIWRSLLQSS